VSADSTKHGTAKVRFDAKLGPCSAEIKVIESSTDPVEGAEVSIVLTKRPKTRSQMLKTDQSGRVLFLGLPNKSPRLLEFMILRGTRTASLSVDLNRQCNGTYEVVLPDRSPAPEK
jgi:hypothetical protein